jgi:D-alanyl-D-alanine carboxypeptidase
MTIAQFLRITPLVLGTALYISPPLYVWATEVNDVPAAVVSISQQQAAYKRLDEYFDGLQKHNKFIGSVALYKDGRLSYQKALTIADQENGGVSKTDKMLRYRVGSISKIFTSVMILQLIEEGKLRFDSQLSEFYPKVKNAEKISISQLLTHHTGIRSYTDDLKFLIIYQKPQTTETIMAMIEGYDSDFEPGSQGKYSNSNFYLLGHIIEKVTNESYADNLKNRIVEKVGLQNTYYGGQIGSQKNEVSSYIFEKEKWQISTEWDMSLAHGAGAVVSTTADLNQFFHALFASKLIDKASLDSMLRGNNGFGKGIFKTTHADADSYGHNGKIDGFYSRAQYIPEKKLSFTILSNGMNYSQKEIVENLLLASAGKLVDMPDFKYIAISPQSIQKMLGQYKSDTHPLGIKISGYEGEIFAQADGQGAFPLTAKSHSQFEFKDAGIEVEFDVSAKRFVIKQGGRADIFVLTDVKPIEVPKDILQLYVGIYKSPDFPLDVEVLVENGILIAQATGQGVFPLTPQSTTNYLFVPAGIELNFDATKSQLILSQNGIDTVLSKE